MLATTHHLLQALSLGSVMEESSVQLFLCGEDPPRQTRPRTFSGILTVGALEALVEMTGVRSVGGGGYCEFESGDREKASQLTPLWTFGATSRSSSPSSAGPVSSSTAVKKPDRLPVKKWIQP